MTPDPPPRPARRTRPDAAFRQRALGSTSGPAAPSPEPEGRPSRRPDFRTELSRIPDLDRSGAEVPRDEAEPATAPVARQARPVRAEALGAPTEDPARADAGSFAVGAAPSAPGADVPAVADLDLPSSGTSRRTRTSAPPPPPWWRRVTFAVVLVALIAAIPVLGRSGYRLVTRSTDGQSADANAEPGEPGYEEQVVSTPTAVLIQKDALGTAVNLTFLSLSADTGGSIIFVPLDTKVARSGFGVDRLRTAYFFALESDASVDGADRQLADQVAAVLNVGVDQAFRLDDAGWAKLVEPVGPLSFDNSDPLELAGTSLPSGPVEVPADLVGPYLASTREGEDDASRFFRQEQLWRSWLAAIGSSDRPDAVPGETTTGLGLFLRRLAAGTVTYATLPGTFEAEGPNSLYLPDEAAINELIVDAVPAPDAAQPGSRVAVRLLNGVAAAPIPTEITSKVVALEGTIIVVGNGPRFGSAETDVIYADPEQKAYAERLRAGLGATGKVRLDPGAPDNVGVTVVLGKDLLGDQQPTTTVAGGSPGSASSSTTTPPGGP